MPCILRWLVQEGTKANAKNIFALQKSKIYYFKLADLFFSRYLE
jgi:hypothetical protein